MDLIPRILAKTIAKNQKRGQINVIYGPRQVGKTTLLRQLVSDLKPKNFLWLNGDLRETNLLLSQPSLTQLTNLVKDYQVVVVDEAQRITNIGLVLKILIDYFPKKIFYVSGSSSLALARGIQEPLTGRTQKYRLFPLSINELGRQLPQYQRATLLEEALVFGGYPYLTQLKTPKEKTNYLYSLIDDYLFRDILALKEVGVPENLRKLATLLAFQIGQKVSLNELANNLNIDVKTVRRYLELLKQGFIILEISSFSRNLRKEVAKGKKYYFWDLGIRNALIGQFLPLDQRADRGQLWENFLAVERIKKHEYQRDRINYYFWRTYDQVEIDWVEVDPYGKIKAFEFKWQKTKRQAPKSWRQNYPESSWQCITQENFWPFINSNSD